MKHAHKIDPWHQINTNTRLLPTHHTGEKLGIFYDVRDDAKGRVSKKSKRL